MTIKDNELTWTDEDEDEYESYTQVGYVSNNFDYGQYDEPIWIRTGTHSQGFGFCATTEQAREIAAHLILLADEYEAAKPKEPTRAERWEAAPIGTIVTVEGRELTPESTYRVKVAPNFWASSTGNVWGEQDFHPSWDIVGTKN